MTVKLTLTIDPAVVSVAKKYAKRKGKSLSGIVENYFKTLTAADNSEEVSSPRILKLMGVIKLPDNFDYKKELARGLSKNWNK